MSAMFSNSGRRRRDTVVPTTTSPPPDTDDNARPMALTVTQLTAGGRFPSGTESSSVRAVVLGDVELFFVSIGRVLGQPASGPPDRVPS